MKSKILFLFLMIMLVKSVILPVNKITVAILKFSSDDANLGQIVEDKIQVQIFENVKSFELIDRKNLNKILKEHKIQLSGITNSDNIVKVGKILNVEKIITGDISEIAYTNYLKIQITDVSTGKIDLIEQIKWTDRDEFAAEVSKFVRKLLQKYPLSGNVIKILRDRKKFLIDIGSKDFLNEQDIVTVYRKGEEIRDLKGNLIGETKEKIGTGIVYNVEKNFAFVKTNSDYDVKVGDLVFIENVKFTPMKQKYSGENKKMKKTGANPKKENDDDFMDSAPGF